MAGYNRSFNETNGEIIDAPDFVNEFEAISLAFDEDTGHLHDNSANNGAYIPIISDQLNQNEILIDSANFKLIFSINVSGTKTAQLEISDGALVPSVTNDLDLGSVSNKLKDIHAAGNANLSVLALTSGVSVSGILDEDILSSDSDTALATQQSIKAYVDNHDWLILTSPDGFNVIEIDNAGDQIIISTDVASTKTNKFIIDGSAAFPATNLDIDLGKSSNKFGSLYVNSASLGAGVTVNKIFDEDTMASDDAAALATQQSIKAYIDANILTINDGLGTVANTTVPTTAKGLTGDLAGMIAADATYTYFCYTDWIDGVADIWSRAAIATW